MVWERKATESLIKKTITMGENDILPNFVAGGTDAKEGTYVWNYTVRSCQEEELEELYNGRMGVFKSGSVVLDGSSGGQRAWLRIEPGVTICGRRMRRTHLRTCMWSGTTWTGERTRANGRQLPRRKGSWRV